MLDRAEHRDGEAGETKAGAIPVTISIGLTTEPAAGLVMDGRQELVRAADAALYRAKANARNRVEHACGPGEATLAATRPAQ